MHLMLERLEAPVTTITYVTPLGLFIVSSTFLTQTLNQSCYSNMPPHKATMNPNHNPYVAPRVIFFENRPYRAPGGQLQELIALTPSQLADNFDLEEENDHFHFNHTHQATRRILMRIYQRYLQIAEDGKVIKPSERRRMLKRVSPSRP